MFERDDNLEVTVVILLEKYHKNIIVHFVQNWNGGIIFGKEKLSNVNEQIQGASKKRKRVYGKPGFTLEDPQNGIIEALNFPDTDCFRKLLILRAT